MKAKKCTDCVNCDAVHGFIVTCRCSYDEERDGHLWHIQCGQDVHYSRANKCDHYSEKPYGRDEMFVL